MRKKTRRRRNANTILLILITFALISGFFIYRYFNYPAKTPSSPRSSTPTSEPKQHQPQTPTDPAPPPEKKPIPQYEGENPNHSDYLTGSISSAHQLQNKLIIRVNVDQYLSSGTCTLILKQNNIIKHQSSARLIGDVSTSTCEGFDLDTTNLPSGHYQIIIELSSAPRTGQITGEVNLK